MIFWVALAVFLIPLIYCLSSTGDSRRARSRKLDQIQRRLAEKEAEAQSQDRDEPQRPS